MWAVPTVSGCLILMEKREAGWSMEKKDVLKYSAQIAMLKQLQKKKLISDKEYAQILLKIRKDHGVISDLDLS